MNIPEFDTEFDILYNNIMSNMAPGLNGYEKSVFLTMGQEQLIKEVYTGSGNGLSFEETQEVRRYLDALIKPYATYKKNIGIDGVSKNSVFFSKPKKSWFIVYESADLQTSCEAPHNTKEVDVKPITHDEYRTIKRNPFKKDNENRVLRLDITNDMSELISDYVIKGYHLRYLEKPSPIILEDLSEYNISIDGISTPTECKLNSAIHRHILTRGVQLAKEAYKG